MKETGKVKVQAQAGTRPKDAGVLSHGDLKILSCLVNRPIGCSRSDATQPEPRECLYEDPVSIYFAPWPFSAFFFLFFFRISLCLIYIVFFFFLNIFFASFLPSQDLRLPNTRQVRDLLAGCAMRSYLFPCESHDYVCV